MLRGASRWGDYSILDWMLMASDCLPHQVMLECSEALQNFEDFININYLAFSKILKKHDKLSSCPCRAPYLLRIQRETFARQCLPELIKGISDLHASLVVRSSQPGTPEQTREGTTPEDAEKKKKGGVFDSAQKGGTTFIRSTRKYWVATADVLKVKTFLLRRLPVYKFTDGATDSDLVTSIYFDSPGRQLYEGRLKKFDGAIALRVRWYGPTPAHDDIVYMERKVHREGTPCTGPAPLRALPRALSRALPRALHPPCTLSCPLPSCPSPTDRPSTIVFSRLCLADLLFAPFFWDVPLLGRASFGTCLFWDVARAHPWLLVMCCIAFSCPPCAWLLLATLQIGSTRGVPPPRSASRCGPTRWRPFSVGSR